MRYSNIPPKGSIPPIVRAHQQRYIIMQSAYEVPLRDAYMKTYNYVKLNKFRLAVRQTLQDRLEWTNEEIKLCEESGLKADSLVEIVKQLEEQLRQYW